jgi:hypothetical protein
MNTFILDQLDVFSRDDFKGTLFIAANGKHLNNFLRGHYCSGDQIVISVKSFDEFKSINLTAIEEKGIPNNIFIQAPDVVNTPNYVYFVPIAFREHLIIHSC